MTDDDAVEDVGKSMHEAKQRVKETLQAGTADVDSDAAAAADDDALADTALSALGDETQPSAPATARSITTPTGEVIHDISSNTFATVRRQYVQCL